MEQKVKISIIMQSYNHAKYIRQSIESVLGQTFSDFEFIIIDDASTDDSWSIIKDYTDPRIRTYRNETSKRVENARWVISELAIGEYIAIQHSDDIWEMDKLEKQVAFLDSHPNIGAVFTWAQIIDEDGQPFQGENHFYSRIFEQPNRSRHEWLNHFFYKGNALCHPSVLIRRQCYEDVGLYRFGFAQLPDFDMWVRLCLKYEIHVLPEKLVRFRVRNNEANASGNRPETRVRHYFEIFQVLNNYREISSFEELKKIFPAAQRYEKGADEDIGFVLGMIAIEDGTEKAAEIFGLNLLFEALNDPNRANKILRQYNFGHKEFTKITAKKDVFSIELANNLSNQLAQQNVKLVNLGEQLHEITTSKAWRLAMLFRQIRLFLLPSSSLRTRIAQKLYSLLQNFFKEARLWLTSPIMQLKRYLQACIMYAKTLYLRLPLSTKTKDAHRLFIRRYFPAFLFASMYQSQGPELHISRISPASLENLDVFARGINLPTSLQPIVSMVIPVHGKCEYTLRCLSSIAEHPPSIPFEIIIIDDNSPDNSADILKEVQGVRVISNTDNQGFIRSCNIGAKAAKGEYLHFLNNDTEVMPGWLDELVRTFQELPGTGLAGSKLVYPDGKLQEAGGIIWRDGSAWNFGRYQDQLLPVYNYAREVDYCSGASIMLPKALFEELGGFDEYYLPAYCEDSDLALKIRDRGYRVIYQPLSVVVHYEGVTSGTDITQGAKAYQVENMQKQFERWRKRLETHQKPGIDVDDAKDRMAKRRVLVLDYCTPTPDQDSGSIDTYNILLLLREMGFQVTFIPEDNYLYMPEYTTALQRGGIEVLYAPYCTSVEQHLKESGARYDLAFLFRPGVVQRHIKSIRKYSPKAKVLFHTVDLHYLRLSREAQLLNDAAKQRAANKMKSAEQAAIRAVDITTVVSTSELELLRSELPNEKIRVLPFSRSILGTKKGFQARRDIVFVGGYQHSPNIDAVQYFVNDIMPLLRQRLPGVRFYVVGSKPPKEIQVLASEDVIVTGFVEDLPPLLDQMRVNVAPIRYGAGIKGKIGYAMTVGLPTVATSLAAEGMSLTNGKNIFIADGAEAFANAVTRLYEDELLWNDLSKAGLDFADKTWGAEVAWTTLASILREIGISGIERNHLLILYSPRSKYGTNFRQSIRYQSVAKDY